MGEDPTTLQKHFSEISQTQFVPKSPQDDEQNEISGIFKKVEGSATAFIEGTLADGTAERSVAERCFLALFLGS